MTNEQILKQALETEYALIIRGKDKVQAIDDAVFSATEERLNNEEKDIIQDAPLTGLRDFIDWVLNKIIQFIDWLSDWLSDDDDE